MPNNQNANLSPSQLLQRRKKTTVLAAVILAALVLPPVLLAALFQPGAPNALCKACHEMRGPYQAWSVSQHSDTACDECHKAPSVAKMFLAKIKRGSEKTAKPLEVHVAETNCIACHEGKVNQGAIVVGGIKLNHTTHFNKDISCLTCHKGTGHNTDTAVALLGADGRSLCVNCHNDLHGNGSSDCSVCHAPQGMTLASVTGKELMEAGISQPHHRNAEEQGQDCSKCHTRQFCWGCHVTQPQHPSMKEKGEDGKLKDVAFDHVKQAKLNGKYCTQCHDFDFCTDCHAIKKEHNAKDFKDKGHAKFIDKVATCEGLSCHTEEFCNKCHTKQGTPLRFEAGDGTGKHPDEFVKTHPLFASNTELSTKCLECHEYNFCIACHQGRRIHADGWSLGHARHLGDLAAGKPRSDVDECTRCHTTTFCSECHKKTSAIVAPTHPADFKEAHKKDPQSKTGLCKNCHSTGSCSGLDCHQAVTTPHTPEFSAGGHKGASMTQTQECAKCHASSMCMDCHKTNAPDSHAPAGWLKNHKQPAETSRAFCNLCHDDKEFCGACHKSETVITHREDWAEKGHLDTHKQKDLAECANCHRLDTCSVTCHSPKETSKRHPKEQNHAYCYKCHISYDWRLSGVKACADCHPEPAEQVHDTKHIVCGVCHNNHEKSLTSCASADCHKDVQAQLPKDHVKDGCASCHKTHDWNSPAMFSNCASAKCHADIQKKGLHGIDAHNRCGDCHEPHKAKAKSRDKACTNCHEKATPMALDGNKGLCAKPELDCDDWE